MIVSGGSADAAKVEGLAVGQDDRPYRQRLRPLRQQVPRKERTIQRSGTNPSGPKLLDVDLLRDGDDGKVSSGSLE